MWFWFFTFKVTNEVSIYLLFYYFFSTSNFHSFFNLLSSLFGCFHSLFWLNYFSFIIYFYIYFLVRFFFILVFLYTLHSHYTNYVIPLFNFFFLLIVFLPFFLSVYFFLFLLYRCISCFFFFKQIKNGPDRSTN